ncbi:hypothetical protein JXL21_01620 [Candidatus Bathyarchaeota archaeon]|nr:hypothetical protein [Candidatus Bathyarchaeota archaeon]
MDLYFNLFIGLHLIGGVLGGYLAARGAKGDLIRVGTVTGVMAFIIQQIVYTVFYGRGAVGDAYTMIGIIGGAVSGAVIYKTKADMAQRRTDILTRAKRAASEDTLEKAEVEPVEKDDAEAEEEQEG